MGITQEAIQQNLEGTVDPHSGKTLGEAKSVKSVQVQGAAVEADIVLGYPAAGYVDELAQKLQDQLLTLKGVDQAKVRVTWKIQSHAVQRNLKPMPGVKNMIAVASGKGGVGKSTTAVNLALALSAEGARVGILDADIYGPSQPTMLGVEGRPNSPDGKSIEPMKGHGIEVMSVGFLVEEDTPLILRGPMVTSALTQMLNDTRWGDLDYLIIDMPPGTGDIHLTLSQTVPVSAGVIVTTPQDIALLDAKKGLKMFEKVQIPVLGIIENMSVHICSNCGHEEAIFGTGGGAEMAESFNVDLLGALPLDINIRSQADGGAPSVVADPEGRPAQIYRDIARKMTAKLAMKGKDYSSKFPGIVIQ